MHWVQIWPLSWDFPFSVFQPYFGEPFFKSAVNVSSKERFSMFGCGCSGNTARCWVTPCPAMIELNYFLAIPIWWFASRAIPEFWHSKGLTIPSLVPQHTFSGPMHAFQCIPGTKRLGGLLDEFALLFCVKQNSKKCMVWLDQYIGLFMYWGGRGLSITLLQ